MTEKIKGIFYFQGFFDKDCVFNEITILSFWFNQTSGMKEFGVTIVNLDIGLKISTK